MSRSINRARAFNGDLSYKSIMETYCECVFGSIEPTQIRVNKETWRKLMHKLIDMMDPRGPMQISNARIVYDPEVPEGVLLFYVPDNFERYGALLYLDEGKAHG